MNKSVLIPYDRYIYYKSLVKDRSKSNEKEIESIPMENPDINVNQVINETEAVSENKDDKLEKEIILSHLPKRNRSKALALLNVVDQNPSLDWNNRGELSVKGSRIPFSHISDLVRDALHNSRYEPVGCHEFFSNLDNVPLSLISNPSRRALIGGKSASPLPPPGYPDKKPIPLKNWSHLWKST